jgi:hypothetical protein
MKTQGYLKDLKETNPDKFKEIIQKGVESRQKKSIYKRTFKDIYAGLLSATVVLKDNFGNILKDEKGNPLEITQKEALAIKSIDNIKDAVNLKDIRDIMEIIGEVQKTNLNDLFGSQTTNLREEINSIDKTKKQGVINKTEE